MQDSSGKLSQADKDKIVTWLKEKGKNHHCPVCSVNDWTVADNLLNGMVFSGGNFIVGGPSYPMAFIVCNNCAYTRHFMAVPMGIIPGEDKEPSDGG